MNLVWLSLINKKKFTNEKDKIELAEKAYRLEQSIGLVGGKQDQYASALGGINFLEFNDDKVKITKLRLKASVIKELEDKLILVYTGKPHFSGNSNSKMIEGLKRGKKVESFLKIKEITKQMKTALEKDDLARFAELLNKETEERAKLNPEIVPKRTREMIKLGRNNGAIAAKICGSGGGGCILFFGNKESIKKAFKEKCIDFKFDFEGLHWLNTHPKVVLKWIIKLLPHQGD
jgi:D-glycero-alpha-D-manno-heptose-7-phosphate kinase